MKTYMVVHRAPELSWEIVEKNWRKMAKIGSATWTTTYFNVDKGVRYCVWQAPDTDKLKGIFDELKVSFESMVEVEVTKPDMWGKKWEKHLEAETAADTLGM